MTFLAPLFALLTIPLVVSVFFFFRRKGKEFLKVTVASHRLFLKHAKTTSPKKLVFPPRVFLEAALLLLLALGVMRIARTGEAKRVAAILDISQSMGAQNEGELSRIEVAKKAIKANHCTTCSSFFFFTLFQGEVQPYEIKALDDLTAGNGGDGIEDAMAHFDLGAFDQVHVYTDNPLSIQSGHKNLFWHDIGAPLSNIAVLSATLSAGELSVRLQSYAVGQFSGNILTSEGDVIAVTLMPNEEKEIKTTLQKKSRHLSLTLRTDPQSLAYDRLASDNIVEVSDSVANVEDHTIKLHAAKTYEQLGLTALSRFKERQKDASIEIFHNTALTSSFTLESGKRYFLIAPPSSPWWQKMYEEEVVDYNVASPFLANLELIQLRLPRAISYTHEKWMLDAIRGVTGGILFAGEKDGARVVVLGADLLPLDPQKAPSAAILFLNIVSWLESDRVTGLRPFDAQEGNLLVTKEVVFTPADKGNAVVDTWRSGLAKSLAEVIALIAIGVFLIDLVVGLLLRLTRRSA